MNDYNDSFRGWNDQPNMDDFADINLSTIGDRRKSSMRPSTRSRPGRNNVVPSLAFHESRIIEQEYEEGTLDSMRTVEAAVEGGMDDQDNFNVNPTEDVVVAGGFHNVGIYMTELCQNTRRFKWMYTELRGTLKLTMQEAIEKIPIATIKVFAQKAESDRGGNGDGETIFSYELPLNFKHDADQSSTFYSVSTIEEQWFGFLFTRQSDKKAFTDKMKMLQVGLRKNRHQIAELKNQIDRQDVTIDQIDQPLEDLFDDQTHEQQLSELYDKLVEEGLESTLISMVFNRLINNKTDSNQVFDEESVLFETQMVQFENVPEEQKRSTHERRSGFKKVDDEHLIKLAQNQASNQKSMKERDMRQQRTKFMQEQRQKIIEDSQQLKEVLQPQIVDYKNKQEEKRQKQQRPSGFSLLCGGSRLQASRSQVVPQSVLELRKQMSSMSSSRNSIQSMEENAPFETMDRFNVQLPPQTVVKRESAPNPLKRPSIMVDKKVLPAEDEDINADDDESFFDQQMAKSLTVVEPRSSHNPSMIMEDRGPSDRRGTVIRVQQAPSDKRPENMQEESKQEERKQLSLEQQLEHKDKLLANAGVVIKQLLQELLIEKAKTSGRRELIKGTAKPLSSKKELLPSFYPAQQDSDQTLSCVLNAESVMQKLEAVLASQKPKVQPSQAEPTHQTEMTLVDEVHETDLTVCQFLDDLESHQNE